MPNQSINQIDLVTAIVRHLEKRHKIKFANVRELNTIFMAATSICDEFLKPELPVIAGMGLEAWRRCDHTGQSSLFMASWLSNGHFAEHAYPHDPSDFGRCLGLLEAVPELRGRLSAMRHASPIWAKLIDKWEAFEALYRAGNGEELFKQMKQVEHASET